MNAIMAPLAGQRRLAPPLTIECPPAYQSNIVNEIKVCQAVPLAGGTSAELASTSGPVDGLSAPLLHPVGGAAPCQGDVRLMTG
jgi:hypothetical protein